MKPVIGLLVILAVLGWTGHARANNDVKQVSINGSEFAYVEAGSGDPLVLVHGGLQDHRLWADLLLEFSRHFRVIAYSRRNHFPNQMSADGAPDGAGDVHAEDLKLLISALGLKRVHIVAHSSGAVAAMFFAARNPESVRALALNEPPAAGLLASTTDGPAILREFGTGLTPAREAFRARDFDRAVRLFVDAVGQPGAFERRSVADRRMAMDNVLAHLADSISTQPRAPFNCDSAKHVTVPTLLTNGEHSPRFFHRIVEELAGCLPRAERVMIPNASHTVPRENPQSYSQAILAFLTKN